MTTTIDSPWGDDVDGQSFLLYPTPDHVAAPVCFVRRQPGNLRVAHVLASDAELEPARAFLPRMLRRRADRMGEKLGEGVLVVHRDAYEPGWHIVAVSAPVMA